MKLFRLSQFLSKQGLSAAALARYLRVSEAYLGAVVAGEEALSKRDQMSCLALAARLAKEREALRAVQIELPFGESAATFTRAYARQRARERDESLVKATFRKKNRKRPTRTAT
jgi:plasmid maintenance system antidote protein VapI